MFSQINDKLICESFAKNELKFKQASTIIERNQVLQVKDVFLESIATQIYALYVSNQLRVNPKKEFFDALNLSCLTIEDQQTVNQKLHLIFKIKTLDFLKSFGAKNKKFANLIETNQGQYFKLLGHYSDAAPNEKKGGFHRGNKSIFMNFSLIPPNEWPIIFIHEYLHSLDSIMMSSVEYFADQDLFSQITKIAKENSSLDAWTTEERDKLTSWLNYGLDRGFLGEYRAWSMTLILYLEALNNHKIQAVPWLEKILSTFQVGKEFLLKNPLLVQKYTFKYLDPKWKNPNDYPFSLAPFQDGLVLLRKRLLNSNQPPPLGNKFEEILSDN